MRQEDCAKLLSNLCLKSAQESLLELESDPRQLLISQAPAPPRIRPRLDYLFTAILKDRNFLGKLFNGRH